MRTRDRGSAELVRGIGGVETIGGDGSKTGLVMKGKKIDN